MTPDVDPAPLLALRHRVIVAAGELQAVRCTDPAASAAVDAVKLTRHTLTDWWLPTLDLLLADDH